MNTEDDKQFKLLVDCSIVSSKDDLLRAIYHELDYDEYTPCANLDGLNDLMAPDLFPEVLRMNIKFANWPKVERDIEKGDLKQIVKTLSNLEQDWMQYGKLLTVEY